MDLMELSKIFLNEDYNHYLSDLDENKMKSEIERAEKEADITIIMPQMGVEYRIEPTEEQKALYHKMIDWGADIIFGGHPHVVEPSETVEKMGTRNSLSINGELHFQSTN